MINPNHTFQSSELQRHVSHLVQAYVPRVTAQAQSEETRYSVRLRGGGTA
jgi:hypothetical protein